MIDPFNLPIPYKNHGDIQEFALFAIAVQGKSAKQMMQKVNALFEDLRTLSGKKELFKGILKLGKESLFTLLKKYNIGNYNRQVQAWYRVAELYQDGRDFTIDELEGIKGIGGKTARFIIGYSYGAEVGILDIHILRWLGKKYADCPKSTPTKGKKYLYWEGIMLQEAKSLGIHPMKLDEKVWKEGVK